MTEKKRGRGHPRNVPTKEDMMKLFKDYVKNIPKRYKIEYVGKDGRRVETPLRVPITFEGFKEYCYEKVGCIEQYFVNKDSLYGDYVSICSRIKNIIRQDQIEGGMMGQFNASITQRLQGLKDEQVIEHKEPRIFKVD